MSDSNIVIFGANGGIGNAFVKYYLNQSDTAKVYAFSRNGLPITDDKLVDTKIDVLNETELGQGIKVLGDTKVDRIIIALGTLHTDNRKPEKQLTDIDLANLQEVFNINTFAPVLILKHIKPYINKGQPNVISILSARVGSISDNRLGGWYAYRASKAALNMLIKCTAVEFARSHKRTVIIGIHPGTVDTGLSKPFQGRLKPGQLFTPEHSVSQMAEVIENVTTEKSGLCLAYDGTVIPS